MVTRYGMSDQLGPIAYQENEEEVFLGRSVSRTQIVSGAPNATTTATGKVQLAGDLAGTGSSATAPVISDNAITTIKITADAVTSAKIADGAIVNADINTSAAIADTKLATIATSGKVSNSATTATDANTASAIVAHDANGNFTAGTITKVIVFSSIAST